MDRRRMALRRNALHRPLDVNANGAVAQVFRPESFLFYGTRRFNNSDPENNSLPENNFFPEND
jgi:hypothetical protein